MKNPSISASRTTLVCLRSYGTTRRTLVASATKTIDLLQYKRDRASSPFLVLLNRLLSFLCCQNLFERVHIARPLLVRPALREVVDQLFDLANGHKSYQPSKIAAIVRERTWSSKVPSANIAIESVPDIFDELCCAANWEKSKTCSNLRARSAARDDFSRARIQRLWRRSFPAVTKV